MEFILYGIIGGVIGGLIWIGILSLFKSKPSTEFQNELIRESEERLKMSKKYGEELDKLLEEYKKT